MSGSGLSQPRRRRTRGRDGVRPRVVLIHRYFSPDTPPYATILRKIALGLAENGMDVHVLTCQPSYNSAAASRAPARERIADHVIVTRWKVLPDRSSGVAKIANLIMFGARVARRLLIMPRVDAIMAASTPPVLIALLTSLLARIKGASFVYHNQDIYPEVAEPAGQLPGSVRAVLRSLDAGTDRRADRVVVLSRDMAATITDRGVDPDSVTVINNFDPWTLSDMAPELEPTSADGIIRFIYAGNLGRFQNLEAIARVLAAVGNDERFRFDFVGDGPVRPWLERFVADHGLTRVQLRGYMPPDDLADKLRTDYDVGILSLHPGVIRCAYPSKMMSYLRNGLPVLAMVEQDTELVELLSQYKAGWCADPDNPDNVAHALDELWQGRDTLPVMRDQARQMYETEFAAERQLRRWTELFDTLTRQT